MKPTVVHLVDWLGGGIEQFVNRIVEGTNDSYRHAIIYRRFNGVMMQELRQNAHYVGQVSTATIPLELLEASRLINRDEPSVIHVHSGCLLLYAVRALLGGFPPVVFSEQGELEFLAGSRLYRTCTRHAIRRCYTVAPSEIIAARLRAFIDDPAYTVRVIHNGVDVFGSISETERNEFRISHGIAPSDSLLCFVGQFEEHKGPQDLILAMHGLNLPTVKLVMIGDGSLRSDLEATIERLQMGDCVTIAGRIGHQDVGKWMRCSDVFVMPTKRDGLGIALLEAMAVGMLVIASPVGGIPEAVVDGETGILVPCGQTDALRQAIMLAVADSGLRHRIGHRASLLVQRSYSLMSMVQSYDSLYSSLVNHESLS